MIGEFSVAERLLNVVGWVVGVALAFIQGIVLVTRAVIIPDIPEIVGAIIGWSLLVLTTLGCLVALNLYIKRKD
ncbi:MAG: hypothetical protein AABX53_01640 [Nanoarchaeota archaeon]